MRPRRFVGRLRASPQRRPRATSLPYDIDCLVYSSHKSGTKTLKATLDHSGIPTRHIHLLGNAGMPLGRGAFRTYLQQYQRRNNRKLKVISTFRAPLERHMSSFFQWYGHGVVRNGLVRRNDDTIIARLNVDELQQIFNDELRNGSLVGHRDSLHELCDEVDYQVVDLPFDATRGFGVLENDLMRVHLFRFDLLFPDFARQLEEALNIKVSPRIENFSPRKWYGPKFQEFKATLKVPPDLIHMIYEAKKDLIDIFYPDRYQEILNDQLVRYGAE